MLKPTLLLLTLLGVVAAPAFARDAAFVSAEQSHAFEILPAPPANDSARTKSELARLHKFEETRTPAEVEQAKWDDKNEHVFIYKTVFGETFDAEHFPALAAFAKRVRGDEGLNTNVAKDGFHRPRPYNFDKTLHPVCETKTKDDSYPSGHATSGYLLALTLIDLVPERRDDILARADNYARNRLVCGVHYSSDVQASKLLAYAMHAIMAQNPDYRAEAVPARQELRKALGLSTP